MSSSAIDLFLTYHFLKRLATPFNQWDAFKLGIIDEEGKVLKKASTLTKPEEIAAWGYFDRLVANLKKLLGKVPGGKSKIASYAAALLLIKEYKNPRDIDDDGLELVVEELFNNQLIEMQINLHEEDGGAPVSGQPVNNVGGGRIAALGIGPQGEPPKRKKTALAAMLRRKKPNVGPKLST